jgi:phosphoglycolate phosphatase-like HAD superfamily hydrolase
MHVSFDLDGTLCDSQDSVIKSFEMALSEHGLAPSSQIQVGPPLNDLLEFHVGENGALKREVQKSFIRIYDQELCITAGLYPNTCEILMNIFGRGHTLTLVTNKRTQPAMNILEHYKIVQFFNKIVGSDDTMMGANKLERLRSIRNNSTENIYVGDSQLDLVASNSAGYTFVHASWGYEDFYYENTISDLMQIEKFLND